MVKLGGERLVVGENQGGTADRLNHLGHRECLAGTGDAEKNLVLFPVADPPNQLGNGVFLVPPGR